MIKIIFLNSILNLVFDLLVLETNVSIFSKFNSIATLVHQEEDEEEEEEEEERRDTCQAKKVMQRDGIFSTSFHSLWICVAMLLHMVSETMVEAVCAPTTSLSTAVNACLSESGTGNCPNFAAASNGAGCNNGGVNGVIGDWDVSRVTSLKSVFWEKRSFNADISKWDTSSVTTMWNSTSLSLSLPLFSLIYILY